MDWRFDSAKSIPVQVSKSTAILQRSCHLKSHVHQQATARATNSRREGSMQAEYWQSLLSNRIAPRERMTKQVESSLALTSWVSSACPLPPFRVSINQDLIRCHSVLKLTPALKASVLSATSCEHQRNGPEFIVLLMHSLVTP